MKIMIKNSAPISEWIKVQSYKALLSVVSNIDKYQMAYGQLTIAEAYNNDEILKNNLTCKSEQEEKMEQEILHCTLKDEYFSSEYNEADVNLFQMLQYWYFIAVISSIIQNQSQ